MHRLSFFKLICVYDTVTCMNTTLMKYSLCRFSLTLEKACIDTIEAGKMTKDLSICIHGSKKVCRKILQIFKLFWNKLTIT